jgi:hypothetical protein
MTPDDSSGKALDQTGSQVRASYDAVAAEYADQISDELTGKPLDRALLDESRPARVASSAIWAAGRGTSPITSIGAGPASSA